MSKRARVRASTADLPEGILRGNDPAKGEAGKRFKYLGYLNRLSQRRGLYWDRLLSAVFATL